MARVGMTLQRRLAIAFVLTALMSVLLVGLGMLAIAGAGATSRAEDEVTRGLGVIGDVLGSDGRRLRQLEDLVPANRRDLQLDELTPVLVGDDGSIGAVRRARGRVDGGIELPALTLSPAELAELDGGEVVLRTEGGHVVGLRAVPVSDLTIPQGRLALLARQRVTTVPRQTVTWFLLSGLVVVLGALAAAITLARRLVRPIREIQGATAAIAAGQLTTRIEVEAEGEDELAELAQSVNRMAADLERSKALDQQFLLSVSHDLRTPLTAISGYAEALRDGAVADPDGAGVIIGNHADRLERLVGDLLDLAKLDANRFRLDLRPVDASVVTGRTVAGLAASAATDGVVIEQRVDPDQVILADADRLAQVIGNLVDNAVGFAEERVLVEVRTEDGGADPAVGPPPAQDGAEPATGPLVTVTVSDDGPGFGPEDLPFVFDRLYTGSARPRRAENSTGLGLSIVRELAGAMGGTVAARNAAGGGAAIDLRFPALDPSTITPAAPTPPPSNHRPGASPEPRPSA